MNTFDVLHSDYWPLKRELIEIRSQGGARAGFGQGGGEA